VVNGGGDVGTFGVEASVCETASRPEDALPLAVHVLHNER
jgi:hypothetical protein